MKNIFHYLSIIALMLTISCSTNSTTNPPTQNPVDVYVAGKKDNHACYWKNNQEVILNNEIAYSSNAIKIIVSNNDVYILGTIEIETPYSLKYVFWKNGIITNLTETLSDTSQRVFDINDMDIYENDVYFVGSTKPSLLTVEQYELVYWKNGVKTVFSSNNNSPTDTFIKFRNNNIYLTGKKNILGISKKGYFVNNNFIETPQTLKGIAFKSNDVYVYSGDFNEEGTYYKNIMTGEEVSFIPGIQIYKIVFDGNDKYSSDNISINKNNNEIYEVPFSFFDRLTDFEILNNNSYIITKEGNFGTTDHLYINNVDVFNIQSNFSSMNDIAIVQN